MSSIMRSPDTERCALMRGSSAWTTRLNCYSRRSMKRAKPIICSPSWLNQASTWRPRSSIGLDSRGAVNRDLRKELERASSDLVYSSESDRPFEFFALSYPGKDRSPSPGEFRGLVGASPESPVEIRSLDNFFARHTTTSDPFDSETQRIRPRYEELVGVLFRWLRDVKVYRVGKTEVACYIVGLT